jgi:hypothetical protein
MIKGWDDARLDGTAREGESEVIGLGFDPEERNRGPIRSLTEER